MKEVKEKRYAGPFKQIPFKHYIQSPIGLVPKDGGNATRLIFHLSYPCTSSTPKSVNANTPKSLATVQYPDFSDAVKLCLDCRPGAVAVGKSDLKSAFRNLAIRKQDWFLLVMKCVSPLDGETYYFINKCLPFGAAISCSHFQAFSDALEHIVCVKTGGRRAINYLDDFFFAALFHYVCNDNIAKFLEICNQINFPVSIDKTFWATTRLSFLGLLIDTVLQQVFIPVEKIDRAKYMIQDMLQKCKTTVKSGLLNFFSRCIIPAQVFTRRLYNMTMKFTNKPHYHITLSKDVKLDLQMWLIFLQDQTAYSRPLTDFDKARLSSIDIDMYTDSSANSLLGCGGKCRGRWFMQQWDADFMTNKPSINYLELYAVTCAILLWLSDFRNTAVIIHCDNMSVVNMINNTSSSCKNCMILLHLIVLQGLKYNIRITAKHVPGVHNEISDSLSRLKLETFYKLTKGKDYDTEPTRIPDELWPMSKVWLN